MDYISTAEDPTTRVDTLCEYSCLCSDVYGPLGLPSLSLAPSHSLLFEIKIISLDLTTPPMMSFEDALKAAEEVKEGGNKLITGKDPKFAEGRLAYLRSLEILEPFTRPSGTSSLPRPFLLVHQSESSVFIRPFSTRTDKS